MHSCDVQRGILKMKQMIALLLQLLQPLIRLYELPTYCC